MIYLTITPADTIQTALDKIRKAEEEEILVNIPEGSPIFDNILSLKLLRKESGKSGKKIKVETTDPKGKQMLKSILGEGRDAPAIVGGEGLGFVRGEDIASFGKGEGDKFFGLGFLSRFQEIFSNKKLFPTDISLKNFRSLSLLAALAVFVLGGLIAALLYIPKATVHIKVDSEELVKSIELVASPGAEAIDPEVRALPVVPVEIIKEEKREIETTGKKIVGDKAKGTVTIFNKTDTDRTFSEGAEIGLVTTDETLKFLLDSELYIPKREVATTSAEGVTYTYGKGSVEVTAEEIGEEYNLGADESFSVGGESTDDFVAKNEKAFSGGESREISVITAEDQEKLSSSLETILREEAIESLRSKLVGDQKLEKEAIITEIVGEEFSGEVDDEADELELTMSLKAIAYIYSEGQLNDLLGELLREFVPDQYELSDKDKVVGVESVEKVTSVDPDTGEERQILKFVAKVRGFVIPKLDKDKIKRELVGGNMTMVDDYMRALPNISSYSFELFPPLPGPFRHFPRTENRIEIEIEHD